MSKSGPPARLRSSTCDVMAQYAPKIVEGFFVTIQLAARGGGHRHRRRSCACRGARRSGSGSLNLLIVLFVDVLRALPPLVLIIMLLLRAAHGWHSHVGRSSPPGSRSRWCSPHLPRRSSGPASSSVPRGQWEAARSTGLTFVQTLHTSCCRRRCASRSRRSPTAPSPSPRARRSAPWWRVRRDPLSGRRPGYSFSYNPSPLTLGAIAYLILFVPVVGSAAGSKRASHGSAESSVNFFNIDILREAAPYLLVGLADDGAAAPSWSCRSASRAAWPSHCFRQPGARAAVGSLVLYVDFFRAFPPLVLLMFIAFGLPFTGPRPAGVRVGGARFPAQHLELLRRDLPRRHRIDPARTVRGRALDRPRRGADHGAAWSCRRRRAT